MESTLSLSVQLFVLFHSCDLYDLGFLEDVKYSVNECSWLEHLGKVMFEDSLSKENLVRKKVLKSAD